MFTIIIDTREQTPLAFPPAYPVEAGTLTHGDYSIKGMTDLIAIERKSLPDLVACCGRERDRFKRELHTLRGYRYAAVVIEASRKRVANGNWRGKIQPAHVLGSIASWRVRYGVDFVYADNAEGAADEVLGMLRKFWDWCEEFKRRLG